MLEAVCIMLSIKPDRKPDPSTGKMLDDYWGPSVKLLGDMKFLDRLRLYDKDSIPPAVMQKIRQKLVEIPLSEANFLIFVLNSVQQAYSNNSNYTVSQKKGLLCLLRLSVIKIITNYDASSPTTETYMHLLNAYIFPISPRYYLL